MSMSCLKNTAHIAIYKTANTFLGNVAYLKP